MGHEDSLPLARDTVKQTGQTLSIRHTRSPGALRKSMRETRGETTWFASIERSSLCSRYKGSLERGVTVWRRPSARCAPTDSPHFAGDDVDAAIRVESTDKPSRPWQSGGGIRRSPEDN
jgi:hypothetical protein